TDESVVHPGSGILRDPSGVCKAAFAVNLGVCSITRAELRAAIYGLRLAWELDFRTANLQVDSQVVVSYLKGDTTIDARHWTCIMELKHLLQLNWAVRGTHTYREGNRVADLLTHHGHSLEFGMHRISSFSSEIIDCIRSDMIGVSFSRLISNNI
ncbi:Putative ribonuclease H protein At1g65750, partial [Linum grandiflorum]